MRVIFEPERGQRVPARAWARALSSETIRQLQRVANQPYVVDYVAAMADAHLSNGVAVGTVFATEHTVVPQALGGDLGCGMSAVKIDIGARTLDRRFLEKLIATLEKAIPTGSATHRGRCAPLHDELLAPALSTQALEHMRDALGPHRIGTLGGGNHFIELDRDSDGALWLLVHTGSRGVGAAVASHHFRAADETNGEDLKGLDIRTPAGAAYFRDLSWHFRLLVQTDKFLQPVRSTCCLTCFALHLNLRNASTFTTTS